MAARRKRGAPGPGEEPIPQPVTEGMTDPVQLVTDPPKIIGARDRDNHPDTPRPELVEMRKWWALGDVLLAGVEAIRARPDLLPPLGDQETVEERTARIRKAIATPFYSDTLDRLVSRPFGRSLTFKGVPDNKLPDQLAHLMRNADGAGKDLTALLRDHLRDGIHRGGDCLLVDLPTQDAPRSQADVYRRRPVIRKIGMQDILGWKFRVDDEGKIVTTMLRLHECKTVEVGAWGSKTVDGVRIIQATQNGAPGYSARYERDEKGDWIRTELAPFAGDRVMLHTTWTMQMAATMGRSPLWHLAELNMAYIVGDCEQQYGASYARVTTTWTSGWDKEEEKGQLGANVDAVLTRQREPKRLVRGHKRHIKLGEGGQIGLLESSGSGLAAGRVELVGLEERMERIGAAHMSSQGVTATKIRSDDDRDTSNLRGWCGRVETTAEAVLRDAADLVKATLPDDFSVELFRDWSAAIEREQAMPHVFTAFDRHLIPARIVHDGLRRYGVLTPADTSEKLLQEAEDEYANSGAGQAEAELNAALLEARKKQAAGGGAPGNPPVPPIDKSAAA